MAVDVKYGEKTYSVSLKTAWVNYNCSVKMVGRIRVDGEPGVEHSRYDGAWRAALDAHKRELIHDWVASLENKETFPQLKEGNPIFPFDGGKYLPSVILYSDAVNGDYRGAHWAYAFTAFLHELMDPIYGCTIVSLPGYHNRTYSVYGNNPRFCKVWAIYPPSMQGLLFTPENKKLKEEFKHENSGSGLQEPYRAEVKAAVAHG